MKKVFKQKNMIALTILFVLFIFWNSLQPGSISSSHSSFVTEFLNNMLERLNLHLELTTFFIRKAAHFTEYFILGLLLMGCLLSSGTDVKQTIIYPLFFGLLIPVMDETIQLFVENRSGEVKDVLIDYAGVLTAIICCIVILKIVKIKTERRKGNAK